MVKENKLEGYTQTESLWEVVFEGKWDFILVVKNSVVTLSNKQG